LNEALPEGITDADELDLILTRLRRLEIDIIEATEVDRYRDGKKDVEEEKRRKKAEQQPKLIFWMTRCGCISSRWPGAAADSRPGGRNLEAHREG